MFLPQRWPFELISKNLLSSIKSVLQKAIVFLFVFKESWKADLNPAVLLPLFLVLK